MDEQGNLSDSNDNQVFHLTLNANFDLEESGPIPRIVLGIPDFLVVSELKSVLLAPFENGPGFDELSRKLNESETGRQLKRLGHDLTGPLLESFLDQAKQRAVVFRTDRKKGDAAKKSVNIFVLSGSLAGAAQTLIFRATLVSTGQLRARAARTLERGSLKILFFGCTRSRFDRFGRRGHRLFCPHGQYGSALVGCGPMKRDSMSAWLREVCVRAWRFLLRPFLSGVRPKWSMPTWQRKIVKTSPRRQARPAKRPGHRGWPHFARCSLSAPHAQQCRNAAKRDR